MKTTSMTILALALLSCAAVEARTCKVEITTENPKTSRIYAGPEFFWSHFKGGLENKHIDFSYTRDVYYGGIRFGYEYLRPQGFYACTDAIAALGGTKEHLKQEKEELKADLSGHVRETLKGHRGHLWTNIEQRLGYTWSSSHLPMSNLTWYGGPGFHFEHVKGSKSHWWYLATGLKSLQQFDEHFFVGCDLKVMYAFDAHDQNALILATTIGKKEFWGYEVAVPLEWAVGSTNAFDVQLRPYLLKLNVESPETILGATLALGYNF